MTKKIFLYLFFFLLFFLKSAYPSEKIVFIDINYIFNNSDAGKLLQLEIKNKNDDLKNEINKLNKEISTQKEKLISQKNVLSEDEYVKKVSEIEINVKKMNSSISKKKREIDFFKNKVEREFSKKLNTLIEEFSMENSIDIILNKENLLMAKKNLDITEQIFELFNKNIKQIELK